MMVPGVWSKHSAVCTETWICTRGVLNNSFMRALQQRGSLQHMHHLPTRVLCHVIAAQYCFMVFAAVKASSCAQARVMISQTASSQFGLHTNIGMSRHLTTGNSNASAHNNASPVSLHALYILIHNPTTVHLPSSTQSINPACCHWSRSGAAVTASSCHWLVLNLPINCQNHLSQPF